MEISGQGHLEFDRALSTRAVRSLRLDLAQVDHVNLYALMGMAVATMAAARESHAISIIPPQFSSAACAFISRLGFDTFMQKVGGIPCELSVTSRQSPGDVIVALQTFKTSSELQPLIDLLSSRLAGVAGPQATTALIEALWELGANVTEHSGSPGIVGAVVQRADRKEAHVDFAVGDAGIGIRESFLRGASGHHPNSDHEALTLALEYLVSSVDDPGRGQGLAATVEQATGLRGRVMIRSGDARRQIAAESQDGPLRVRATPGSVPRLAGTLVAVTVPCR
jgi:hypothetical protein